MSYTKETIVGVFVIIGLLCVGYLVIKLGRMESFGSSGYTLTARFASVTGLRNGATVEIAGVSIGRVTSISLDRHTYLATVEMRIDNGVLLSDDVMASIKTSGVIGDKYVAITPGGSDVMLADGGVIFDTEPILDLGALISKFVFGVL